MAGIPAMLDSCPKHKKDFLSFRTRGIDKQDYQIPLQSNK